MSDKTHAIFQQLGNQANHISGLVTDDTAVWNQYKILTEHITELEEKAKAFDEIHETVLSTKMDVLMRSAIIGIIHKYEMNRDGENDEIL